MKTILIPLDFSETSANALKYASNLLKALHVSRVILLKTFYKSIYEQLLPSADFVQLSNEDMLEERTEINQQLKVLANELLSNCNPDLQIETVLSERPLLRAVHDVIERQKPDLILYGSDSANGHEESYIGEQVIAIAKTSPVPVLIIPSDVSYQKISRALIPCDFAMTSRLNPVSSSGSPLRWWNPQLTILNIDPRHSHLEHEAEHLSALEDFLSGMEYKVSYSDDEDVVNGILSFADEQDLQLIVALPGKYSFFRNLTHKSTTEAITLNAKHPILILK
ncbi:universal stress protein [Pedobacter sp. BAL39]|uniref:universal stress protein n=1 Tax=Pedobacter sp. BAL39 TaxID=391596 RepID=UPI00015594EA|nr:universal stress protein [Pedobacter sp. BAL39]EDM37527.1 universal stress protein [Pedobacter sp. BAL39]